MPSRNGKTTQRKTPSHKPRIAFAQVEETLAGSTTRADALRAAGFGALADVKRAKLVQSRRERARVAVRHSENSERAAAIDRKLALEHHFLVGSRAERDRLQVPPLERDDQVWQVHGYLRNQDGFPRAGYTAAVFPDREGRQPALVTATTDNSGYFCMRLTPASVKDGIGGEPPPSGELDPRMDRSGSSNTKPADHAQLARLMVHALDNPVYLGSRGSGKSAPSMDTRALHPTPGAIAYRDLTVYDPDDTGGECHFATRLLGNSNTRELHTLDNEQRACRLAAMRPDHRVYFTSEAEAQKLGYDLCAYCFGPGRSQR